MKGWQITLIFAAVVATITVFGGLAFFNEQTADGVIGFFAGAFFTILFIALSIMDWRWEQKNLRKEYLYQRIRDLPLPEAIKALAEIGISFSLAEGSVSERPGLVFDSRRAKKYFWQLKPEEIGDTLGTLITDAISIGKYENAWLMNVMAISLADKFVPPGDNRTYISGWKDWENQELKYILFGLQERHPGYVVGLASAISNCVSSSQLAEREQRDEQKQERELREQQKQQEQQIKAGKRAWGIRS